MKRGQDFAESWKKNCGEIRSEIEVEDSDENLDGSVLGIRFHLSFLFYLLSIILIMMRIWEGWWWVLGRRFPLFPEEILTKQGNVFIGLPLLVSAVSD